jgi:hypothetical protein
MINYLSSLINTNGLAFPNTLAVNASGPSATDGTEFVKLMIDDYWGRFQAILDYAGLSPDGVTEAPGTSQHIEALQLGFMGMAPGTGVIWWQNDDPSVLGARVLLLNGQGVLRANYAELDANVYVGDGNNATASAFYRADDAGGVTRNIAGIYLILPDLRGYVLRGLDVAASVDPDGASRDLGSVQDFAIENFGGSFGLNKFTNGPQSLDYEGGIFTTSTETTGVVGPDIQNAPSATDYSQIAIDLAAAGVSVATETRMVNIATKYGITY